MEQADQKLHMLLVEDDAAHAKLVRRACRLSEPPILLSVVESLGEARAWMAEHRCDVAVVDLVLPDGKGISLLSSRPAPDAYPLIVLTAQGSEQAAVEALKSGAADYVVKSDVTLADMARIARRSVREWQARAELERARERVHEAQRLARDILDSLPSPIALLDRSGVIRSVNEAWNDSQQPPGLYGAECTVGRDYPSFCRDRGFPEIAAILEETLGQPVLASRAEYSCDSNHEARYIQLCIKPFVGDGQGRAIVMHLDVTAQRRDEAEAKQLAEALRRTQALSRRQMQVLKKMVEGCSNKDIASQLNVSIKTVEMHRANAIKALSASNSTEAIRIALSAFPEWRVG